MLAISSLSDVPGFFCQPTEVQNLTGIRTSVKKNLVLTLVREREKTGHHCPVFTPLCPELFLLFFFLFFFFVIDYNVKDF